MVIAANLGFPSIGMQRELKKAMESYWGGTMSAQMMLEVAADLRAEHWTLQHRQGINHIPSNDFSLYDAVLDMVCTVGAIPERYDFKGKGEVDLNTYFAMARGDEDAPGMELRQWFDTNYRYVVPEFSKKTKFSYLSRKAVNEFCEAKAQGLKTRPVILGPISFLLLGNMTDGKDPLSLLPKLLPVYEALLKDLADNGANWVQMDEPLLVMDLPEATQNAYKEAYEALTSVSGKVHLMLTSYFGSMANNLELAVDLGTAGIHIDLAHDAKQLDDIMQIWPGKKALSLGVVDGFSLWRGDLTHMVRTVEKAAYAIGAEWIQVAPSCSLMHVPADLDAEETMKPHLRNWLSFAKQKLAEVAITATGVSKGRSAIRSEMDANRLLLEQREMMQGEKLFELEEYKHAERLYVSAEGEPPNTQTDYERMHEGY